MARTRSIKPGFFDNDILGDLPPLTRLLFIGLWCLADREGRLEDRPRKIKKAILGYDDVDADGVSDMLQSLHDAGFIIRYAVGDDHYIQVVNFVKHQNPHMKEKASEIPAPPTMAREERASPGTGEAPGPHEEDPEPAGPITGNPLPITGTPLPSPVESPIPEELQRKRFVEFWDKYPKQRNKGQAEKAWKKIKPDTALFEKIMRGLERAIEYPEWNKDNGQFIPFPSTWLNAKGWEDGRIKFDGEVKQHTGKPDGGTGPPDTAGIPCALDGFHTAGNTE